MRPHSSTSHRDKIASSIGMEILKIMNPKYNKEELPNKKKIWEPQGCVWIKDLVKDKKKEKGSPEELDPLTFPFPFPFPFPSPNS